MFGKTTGGVARPPLINSDRKLVVVPGGGRYAEATLAGRIFFGCNQAHVATSATLNNTFTGLAIVNPAASAKNYIIHEFSYAMMDSPAGDTNLSLVITPEHTGFAGGTTLTVRCGKWAVATSSAVACEAATIVGASGVIVKPVGTIGTNLTTDLINGPTVVDLGGQIVVPPGYAISTDTLIGSGDVMLFGFMWEERDV